MHGNAEDHSRSKDRRKHAWEAVGIRAGGCGSAEEGPAKAGQVEAGDEMEGVGSGGDTEEELEDDDNGDGWSGDDGQPPDAPDDAQAAAGGGGGAGGPGMGIPGAPPASDVPAAAAYLQAAEAAIEEDARRSQLLTQPLAPPCTAQGRRQRAELERARVRPSRYDD